MHSCFPVSLRSFPLSRTNLDAPNQCCFVSKREKTVNIQPQQREILILFQTNRSGLIFVIGNQSSLTTERGYQTPQPIHIAGKWFALIPLAQKRGYLMLARCIVSSQSSLDHWSHICKSCRMNGVCVKSLASKQAGWWPGHVLVSPHMLHSVVFPHDGEHEDTFSACSHMWFHFCCDGLCFVLFFSPLPPLFVLCWLGVVGQKEQTERSNLIPLSVSFMHIAPAGEAETICFCCYWAAAVMRPFLCWFRY